MYPVSCVLSYKLMPAEELDDTPQSLPARAFWSSLSLTPRAQRKFSFVTSLKDFAQYFDCLDDVAFISIGPHQYYKVGMSASWCWGFLFVSLSLFPRESLVWVEALVFGCRR